MTNKQSDIKQFLEDLFGINATYQGWGGAAPPALGSLNGAASNSEQLVYRLRRYAVESAQSVEARNNEKSTLLSQEIEGILRTLQILGQISEQRCDKLINELHLFV